MTIRFLNAWNGYDDQDIATLSSAEESRLVGLGLATYTIRAERSAPATDSMVFESLADIPAGVVGPILLKNGREYVGHNGALIPGTSRNFRTAPISISASDASLGRNPFNIRAGVRALPTLSGITAIKFIDTNAATNGDGSFASPLNALPVDFAFLTNTAYLLKAGTEINIKRQSNVSNVIFGSYGNGPKPIWRNGSGDRCLFLGEANNSVVYGIEFFSDKAYCISNDSTSAVDAARAVTILGCGFSMGVDTDRVLANQDSNAISFWGAGLKVIGNFIRDIPADGIWIQGHDCEIAYNIVERVAIDGRIAGDCVQIEQGNNAHIHHNVLDHSSNGGKQVIVLNAADGGIVEYNLLTHIERFTEGSENIIYTSNDGTIIRSNFMRGGRYAIRAADNITISGNIIENSASNGRAISIETFGLTYDIKNNTLIGNTTPTGIFYGSTGTAPTALRVINNIIQGFTAGAVTSNNASNLTIDSNCYHNNGSLGAASTKSLLIDPRLDEKYVPQEPLVHSLGAQYDTDALTTTGAQNDVYGTAFGKSIGAIQPDAIDFDEVAGALYWSINGI